MHKKREVYRFNDARGSLVKILDKKNKFCQSFVSYSKKKVFRGFHFYKKQNKSNRVIYLLKGEIIDYIVDLRSKTFGKLYKIRIKENSKYAYKIPWYFAHAFLAIKDSMLIYFFEKKHIKKYDAGINCKSIISGLNDKSIIISERDLMHPEIGKIKKF